jgi:hypothetical protein
MKEREWSTDLGGLAGIVLKLRQCATRAHVFALPREPRLLTVAPMTYPELVGVILGVVGVVLSGGAWRWALKAANSAEEAEKKTRKGVAMCAKGLNELLKAAGTGIDLRFDEHGDVVGQNVTVTPKTGELKVSTFPATAIVTKNEPKT